MTFSVLAPTPFIFCQRQTSSNDNRELANADNADSGSAPCNSTFGKAQRLMQFGFLFACQPQRTDASWLQAAVP